MAAQRFEELAVWREARTLVRAIYRVTRDGRFGRDRDLRRQIRRAAVSSMSNIAEGFERKGDREFRHFLSIAKGSCGEVRSQLYVALDEGYIGRELSGTLIAQSEKLNRMLTGLIRYLQRKPPAKDSAKP